MNNSNFQIFPKNNFNISIVSGANVQFFIIFKKNLTLQRHPKGLVWSKGLMIFFKEKTHGEKYIKTQVVHTQKNATRCL